MSTYSLLGQDRSEDSEKGTGENESRESFDDIPSNVRFHEKRGFWSSICAAKGVWAFHLAIAIVNVGFFVLLGQSLRHSGVDFNIDGMLEEVGNINCTSQVTPPPGVLPYHSIPIEMTRERIAPGGVHNNDPNPVLNDYEGRPNERNTAAWERLMEVGFTDLDPKEYGRMEGTTAANIHGNGGHVVAISLFHQLHCVNLLRRRIWDAEDNIEQSHHPLRIPHLDHCIDYLRQIFMCNGDLTPATFTVAPGGKGYVPKFNEEHQCRNFETIFEWAKERNNGVPIDPPLFD
ncbi:hypothetical protein MMC17_000159 [Xylographa soralifera]|nr:hypothetical protein [Xylographa soralifera]